MLTIGIDMRPLFFTRGGIARYLRCLVSALFRVAPEHGYHLLCPKTGAGLIQDRGIPQNAWTVLRLPLRNRALETIWENLFIPVAAAQNNLDVLHFPRFSVPRIKRRPAVVTIHDLAFRHHPETLTPAGLAFFRRSTAQAVERADVIIAVSGQTRQDLVDIYGISPHRVYRIYNGVEPHFCPGDPNVARNRVRRRYGLDAPYILFLGTLEPRKNAVGLIRAYDLLCKENASDCTLALAGGKGWLYKEIFETVESLNLQDRIRFLGHVDEADLPDLYRGARVFVYPSFYEGFGLPILEAMACGVPVVTSRTSSLPEVSGDAALLVDPDDPESLAHAMKGVLEDETLASRLQEQGYRRAAEFSWERAARETLDVYQTCLG